MADDRRRTQMSPKGKLIGGRYRVVRSLGAGGIGKVFLVDDIKRGRQLALKMLRTKYQDNGRAMERFAREVILIRKLNHPCIVKVFDARKDGDTLFYTMEFVDGKSVRQWMKDRKQLQFGSVVRVLSLIAHALEHAHKVTIHRDISPENVMVLPDGSVRLLDFGLAKLTDTNQALTMVGVSLGKLAYVAPEQRLNAAKVDQRADIYSLGVMFHEMLAGELPDGTRKFSKFRPDLPRTCDAFLDMAMAPEPENRFATAEEFRIALAALYEDFQGKTSGADTGASKDGRRAAGFFARLRALWGKIRGR